MSKGSRRSGQGGSTGAPRPTRPAATGPAPSTTGSRSSSGTPRAGRREQRRPRYDDRSFLEKHRGTFITVGVLAAVALVVAFVFVGATQKTYACTTIWQPEATPTPSAGASPRAGYLESDMGRSHIRAGDTTVYPNCPPASGDHYNTSGLGPVQPRFYAPDEPTTPQGWIHNLEHGGLVLLYRCGEGDKCDEETFTALRAFVSSFPNSPICALPKGQISPVVARFDEMATPFTALVWGRLLPLDKLDTDAVLEFFRLEAERTNPEKLCAAPSPSPSPAASAGASPSPSGSPSGSPSAAPSESPAGSPSPSPAASPSPS